MAERKHTSKTLTDAGLRALKARDKPYEIADPANPGFRVRVQKSGSRRFLFTYRESAPKDAEGKPLTRIDREGRVAPVQGQIRRIDLGEYVPPEHQGQGQSPPGSLAHARGQYLRWRAQRADAGQLDPYVSLALEMRRRDEAAAQAVRAMETVEWTMHRLGRAFVAALRASRRRPRTLDEVERHFRAYVDPVLGEVSAHEVTPKQIESHVLAPLAKAGKARMHDAVRTTLVGCYSWATRARKTRLMGEQPPAHLEGLANPAGQTQLIKSGGSKAQAEGEDVLRGGRLAVVWRALTAESGADAYLDVLAVQLATGQRIGELSRAKPGHVSLEDGTWLIPGGDTKNGYPQRLFLSPQVIRILEARITGGRQRFIFPVRNAQAGHVRADTSNVRLKALQATLEIDSPVSTHGLRKTALTHIAGEVLSFPDGVRQRIANHMPRDPLQATYVRERWDGKAREAWQAWGAYLDSFGSEDDKIIVLKERGA